MGVDVDAEFGDFGLTEGYTSSLTDWSVDTTKEAVMARQVELGRVGELLQVCGLN